MKGNNALQNHRETYNEIFQRKIFAGFKSTKGFNLMSCLCCKDLREKVEAIEKAQREQGFAFVRTGGELKLIIMSSYDCIHRNAEIDDPPTKQCTYGLCIPAGCDHFTHQREGRE